MNAVSAAVARSPSKRSRAKTTAACSQTHGFRDHLVCGMLVRHDVLRHKRARTNDGCGARGGGDPMNVTHDEPGVVQLQLQPFVDEPRLELLLQPGAVGTLPTHYRSVGPVVRLVPGYDAFGTAVRHVPDLDHAVVVVVRVGDEIQMHAFGVFEGWWLGVVCVCVVVNPLFVIYTLVSCARHLLL